LTHDHAHRPRRVILGARAVRKEGQGGSAGETPQELAARSQGGR
jgi:hypothetical protein